MFGPLFRLTVCWLSPAAMVSRGAEKHPVDIGLLVWNRLPLTVHRKESADSFKIALKSFLHSDADVFDT